MVQSSLLQSPATGLDAFGALGEHLEDRWRAADYREETFPSLAAAALRDRDLPSRVSPTALLDAVLEAKRLPRQDPIRVEFPVTVFHSERFAIDLLFWVDGTTAIHDHAFWGAFQVLAGSSLHTTYAFEVSERLTSYLAVGELGVRGFESLRAGDVREIEPGPGFIHSLFHLDRPSVSLVISTRSPAHYASGFTYLLPGFAWVERFAEQRLTRQLGALELVHRTWPDAYEDAVVRFVARADPMYAFCALRQAHLLLEEAPFARALDAFRPRNPALVGIWDTAFEEQRRQGNIVARRALVHDPDHRFFLATVLNAPRREVIFRLAQERVPDREPVDTIVQWVRELSAHPVDGPAGPTAIGAPLDEAGLLVLRALLLGRSPAGVFETLEEVFDRRDVRSQQHEILDLIRAFRESLLFRPLLADPTH